MAPDRAASLALAEAAHQTRLDLDALQSEADEIARGLRFVAERGPDSVWLAYLAVHLDRFYTAAESAFERIARAVGEPTAGGAAWHETLLHQMTLPIQDVRPAVVRRETADALRPVLKFRHWLRHAYRAPFEWSLMRPIVEGMPGALDPLRRDLVVVAEWLEEAAAMPSE